MLPAETGWSKLEGKKLSMLEMASAKAIIYLFFVTIFMFHFLINPVEKKTLPKLAS